MGTGWGVTEWGETGEGDTVEGDTVEALLYQHQCDLVTSPLGGLNSRISSKRSLESMTHTKRLDYKMLTFASSCSISSAMVSKTCPEPPTTEFSELEKRHAEVIRLQPQI